MEQGWSQIPERIGEFAIVRELGVGRRGRVLLGEPHGGGDRVAIAVMDPAHARDRLARRRFARGIDEARRVRGPGIPGVVAADSDAPIPWVATQYLPGPSLAERVAEQGPLPQPEALDVVADIATALHTMHAAGVTHGELDPTYVILAPGGACVVGVGAHPQFDGSAIDDPTADGTAVGFLAPEQVTEDWVGPPADIFSLGAVAYFAATGRSVFGVGSGPEVAGRLVHDEPDLTALANPRLRGLVWDCLAKDPSGRPRADEVARFARPGTQTRPPALEVGGVAPVASPPSNRPQDQGDQGTAPESGGSAAAAAAAAGVAGSAVARAASSAGVGVPAAAAGPETPGTNASTPGVEATGTPAGGTGLASAGPGGRTRGGDTGSSRIRRVLPILVAAAVLAQLSWVAWSSRGGVEPTSSSTRTAAATPRRAALPAPATTPTASPGAVRSATAAPQPVFPALPLPRRPGTIEPSVQIAPLPPALPVPVIPAPVPAPTRVPTTRTAAPNPAPSSPAPSSRPTSTRPTTTEPTTVPTTPTREPTRPTVSTLPEEPSVSPILPTRPATVDPAPEPTRPRPTQPDPGEADVPTSPDRVTLTSTRATSAAAEGPGPAPVPPSEPTVRPPAATSPVTSPGD